MNDPTTRPIITIKRRKALEAPEALSRKADPLLIDGAKERPAENITIAFVPNSGEVEGVCSSQPFSHVTIGWGRRFGGIGFGGRLMSSFLYFKKTPGVSVKQALIFAWQVTPWSQPK